jgi:uncharacterized protein (TIGR00369 family)
VEIINIKAQGTSMTPEQTLDLWMTEERAALGRLKQGPGPGVAHPDQIAGKSGLEIMQAMMKGELPCAECENSLRYCAIKVAPGHALFQGATSRSQRSPMGTIHGGWISSMLDSVLGCAVMTTLSPGILYSTTALEVKYLKFLTLKTLRVRAEAKVREVEGRDVSAEAILFGPDGTLFARASTMCRLAEFAPKRTVH